MQEINIYIKAYFHKEPMQQLLSILAIQLLINLSGVFSTLVKIVTCSSKTQLP